MTDQNTDTTNDDQNTGQGGDSGRPGGAPDRTLAAERIEALESQIRELGEAIKAGNAQAAAKKDEKRTMEDQVAELIAAQERTQTDLKLAKIETAAAKIGAKDPDLVAQLVAGEANHLAAIERLKSDKPYLFGAPARPAGADMNSGSGSAGSGMDDLDKHLADRYGSK